MTYDQLLTLEAIVKSGSFKGASEILHKTQPSISAAIKKLEQEFQVVLFNRNEYRPSLTKQGEVFFNKAKIALFHMRNLETFGEELGMNSERELKLGVDGLVPLIKLLPQFKQFFNEYNSTELIIETDNISGTMDKLINQKIDLGLLPIIEMNEELEIEKVYEVEMIAVIANQNNCVSLSELKKHAQIIVTDSGKLLKSNNYGVLGESKKWTVSDMTTKKNIITSGIGWGRIPCFMAETEIDNGQLVRLEIPEIKNDIVPIYLARNKNKALGPVTKLFWQAIKDVFG